MTDYPTIDPADVREGDVVQITWNNKPPYTTVMTGPVTKFNHSDELGVDGWRLEGADDLRLIARPALPLPEEPAVGEGWFHDGRLWVRISGDGGLPKWHSHSGTTEWRAWADIQPGVPAVPGGNVIVGGAK